MSIALRILLIIVSLLTFFGVMRQIRKSKLHIEQAIFWILLSFGLVVIAIFPGIMYWLSRVFKVQSPSNMVFLIMIFVLLMKSFTQTLELFQLEHKLQELVQEIAIRDHEKSEVDKQDKNT